ncbi:hypothetical protein ACFSQ7_45815 [Paenibacillus rhizoplanae]
MGKEHALYELIGDRQADAGELKLALKKFYTASLKKSSQSASSPTRRSSE